MFRKKDFDISEWFVNTTIKTLKKNYNFIYPKTMVASIEEWNFILDKMIYHLSMMKINNILESKNIKEPTYADYELANNIKERNKKHFFELFEKYCF